MWKNININIQNIKFNNGSSVLINCPNKSKYDGYSFWHSAKLVRNGKNSYSKSLGYTNDFKFILKKYRKSRYNSNEVIDEKEISVEDFEEMFNIMNKNIVEPKINIESYVIIEDPKKIDKDIIVEECLKNN